MQRDAGDLVSLARAALGRSYGGVWFDNVTGRFRIAVVSSGGQAEAAANAAKDVAKGLQIDADTDTVSVAFGWDELTAAQAEVNAQLTGLLDNQLVSTTIDPTGNAVTVHVSPAASTTDVERIKRITSATSVPTAVVTGAEEDFAFTPAACSFPSCDRPLRGGVRLRDLPSPSGAGCSAGYLAIQNNTGNRYMLTAGHCAHIRTWWAYHTTTSRYRSIGQIDHFVWDSGGDYARISATGSFWDTSPWAPQSAFWGINEIYPTRYTGWSYPGLFGCRTGGFSAAQCGTVTESGTTQTYGGVTVNGLFRVSACGNLGDSGGPFMLDYYAVGILNAVSGTCDGGGGTTLYSEVMNAQVRMNALLARNP